MQDAAITMDQLFMMPLFGHVDEPTTPRLSDHELDLEQSTIARGLWSESEHERFLQAMKRYPRGPWRAIADHVRTRSIKQVQTHAQKYQQKVVRRQRGLRKQKKRVARPEHRVDQATTGCIARKLRLDYATTMDSPRSPSAFMGATPPQSSASLDEIELALLLDGIEPLPFRPLAADQLAMRDSALEFELRESLQLFLDAL